MYLNLRERDEHAMTLRAGSYDVNYRRPVWQGVIRDDGTGWYHCTHRDHGTRRQARDCATRALPEIRATVNSSAETITLPPGWISFTGRAQPVPDNGLSLP
jgi:hypothetical protein